VSLLNLSPVMGRTSLPTRFVPVAVVPLLVSITVIGLPTDVTARSRPLFEPTDLELEETGMVEVDLQLGAVRSQGPWRAVLPDFELDFGVLPNLELDLDGAYAIEGPTAGPFSFDHAAPDSLWPSVKWGLYDSHDPGSDRAWALGLQVGPKIPVASGSRGLGAESLLLVGRYVRRVHTVLNLGGFVDPAAAAGAPRPVGVELGLDVDLDLDDINRFSFTAEISAVRFVSSDPNQLLATAGLAWSVTPSLELSLAGMYGFLDGNDRYGLLLGLSPKVRLFRP
jgi:hypothetical protein